MIRIARKKWSMEEVLALFDPLVREWFTSHFTSLTEPQAYAIPLIHRGKSVLVSSPTGSGKTLTAFISIINELLILAKRGKLEDKVYCVYISPLKALANDIRKNLLIPLEELHEMAKREGLEFPKIRVAVRSGDTSQYERQKMLKKPPHIFITTPESFALALTAPKMRERFRDVKYVIVDEIHEVASSKRGVMLSLNLERLEELARNRLVRIGLSATIAPLEEIAKFLAGYDSSGKLRDITVVNVFHPKEYDIRVISPVKNIFSTPYEVASERMYDLLYDLIMEHRTTLVFTNTRSGAESVAYKLRERGLDSIEVHHGSLSKEIRLDVEDRLKKGELKCVVSSTSLELGIDIGYIDLVVQIGSPKSVAKGVQRIGRSGHQVHAKPKGRFIVIDPDDLIECTVLTKCAYERKIDRIRIPKNCLDVLAQVLVGMSLERRWNVDEAFSVIRRSYCYHELPKEKFLSVLRYLGGRAGSEEIYSKLWYDEEEGVFGRKRSARMIYFMNIGTIPDEADYVVITTDGRRIGELSEKFVEYLRKGDVFVLGSRTYEFIRTMRNKVYVRDAEGRRPTVPSWVGEMLPRSFDLSVEVGKFREEIARIIAEKGKDYAKKYLMKNYYLDEKCAESIVSYVCAQMEFIVPTHRKLVIEGYIDPSGNYNIIFHYPFGRRVNDALSRAYAYAISNQWRVNARISVTDDAFMLTVPKMIPLEEIPSLLNTTNFLDYLKRAIKDTELFKQRFRHTATRSFMVLRKYKSHEISVARQQLRSERLLAMLHSLEDFPIIEETYNEILNIVMDVDNALLVLESIERGKIDVEVIDYSTSPSPFAHNVILAGISDIVLMEDRSALLKELHFKLLERIMPVEEMGSASLFRPEVVKEYFEKKIPRIEKKEEILHFLNEVGFGDVLQERGISIYPYASVDRNTLRKWAEELIMEDKIVSVYLRRIVWTSKENESIFYTLYSKNPGEDYEKYLPHFKKEITLRGLARKLKIGLGEASEIVRELERGYLIRRKVKGFVLRKKPEKMDRKYAARILVEKLLRYFAPLTLGEISYRLALPEDFVRDILKEMEREGVVKSGIFTLSDERQYMLAEDFNKLIKGEKNKCRILSSVKSVESIEEYFSKYLMAFSPHNVYVRCKNFNWRLWKKLRREGFILYGRLVNNRLAYTSRDSIKYFIALNRRKELSEEDREVLAVIRGLGESATFQRIVARTGYDPAELKLILLSLERNLYLARRFHEGEDVHPSVVYEVIDIPTPKNRDFLIKELAEKLSKNFGIRNLKNFAGIEYSPKIQAINNDGGAIILSRWDPALHDFLPEITAKFGEDANFILVKDCEFVAAANIVNDGETLTVEWSENWEEFAEFFPKVMDYFRRDFAIFRFNPYPLRARRIGPFSYAYGNFSIIDKDFKEILRSVMWRNHLSPDKRFTTLLEMEKRFLGINSDFEAWNRCWKKISMEKYFISNFLYIGVGKGGTLSYMSMDTASLLASARSYHLNDDEKVLLKFISENHPMTKEEIAMNSPLGTESLKIIEDMFSMNMLLRDHKGRYIAVERRYPMEFAREEIVRKIMDILGMASSQRLYTILKGIFTLTEIRNILADLVDKGDIERVFMRGREELFYSTRDFDCSENFDGLAILDPSDLLTNYLKPEIGERGSWYIIVDDGEIVGKFRAKKGKRKIKIFDYDFPEKYWEIIRSYYDSFGYDVG